MGVIYNNHKKKIWLVSSREGVYLNSPQICYSETDAYNYVKAQIASLIRDDHAPEEMPTIDYSDNDAVVKWGKSEDICKFDDKGMYYEGRMDWSEYIVNEDYVYLDDTDDPDYKPEEGYVEELEFK